MQKEALLARIDELRKEKKALILAHNYQPPEIQDVADFCGDSFELSEMAAQTEAEVLVFCGVHFMAETAKMLAPEKTVLLPEESAGCQMADMVSTAGLRSLKQKYPQAAAVCYINSSAEVKAECDAVCTSSNALSVVESFAVEEIIFVPDRNLADYIQKRTKKKIIPWDGCCGYHNAAGVEDVAAMRKKYPEALLMVHPEARPSVVELADFAGGTGAMIDHVAASDTNEYIVGTEVGMLYPLAKRFPERKFYPLSEEIRCPDMKKISLESIVLALENMAPQITVSAEIAERALRAVERMLEHR